MDQRTVIKIASAVALLTAAACSSDDSKSTDNSMVTVGTDAAAQDASRPDAGGGTLDARVQSDAQSSVEDARAPDASELDAAADAAVVHDAQIDDAGTDAAATTPDASTVSDAAADAALTDAATTHDAATPDAGPTLPTLAAWYKFDENSGTAAADATGSFGNATLQGGATWATGKHGSAVNLAGGVGTDPNNYVSLPADVLHQCHDVTIALWMKLGSNPVWSRLLDLDGTVDGFLYFTPHEDVSGTPHLLFDIYHPTGIPNDPANDQRVSAAYPAGVTVENTWHHVAFTLTGGTGRLYFDGVQIGSNPMNTTPADVTIGTAPGVHAWIGKSMFNDAFLQGAIDDVRVSCTAYTAAQIAAIAQ